MTFSEPFWLFDRHTQRSNLSRRLCYSLFGSIDAKLALDLAVFGLADELDVPPRRVRTGLGRFLKRLRETNINFEMVERQLQAAGEAPATPHT